MQQPERQPDIPQGTAATPSSTITDTMPGGTTTQIEPEVKDPSIAADSHGGKTAPSASTPPNILPEMSAACETVLTNPYLFEHIFSKLRMLDLLRCMRVSNEWKKHIDSSVKLQQTLFFQPIETSIVVVPSIDKHWFACRSCDVSAVYPPEVLYEGDFETVQGYITHPLLINQVQDTIDAAFTEGKTYREQPTSSVNIHGGTAAFAKLVRDYPERPSWTRMLVAQPSPEFVYLRWLTPIGRNERQELDYGIWASETDNGITWGTLCTAILKHQGVTDSERRIGGIEMNRFYVPAGFAIYDRPHPEDGHFCEACQKQHRSLVMEVRRSLQEKSIYTGRPSAKGIAAVEDHQHTG
ncbi:hypothetical protein KVT40_004547 [Elsinoe batatas]|uniref:F-box domain-containing protein n=1 Tax=Elsinoe batatas TaxID=2601811 RepID=A0A8K0KZV2_9PEZI|nr:hypothetical protein KVT40_004547 [Elsinoe batatas]